MAFVRKTISSILLKTPDFQLGSGLLSMENLPMDPRLHKAAELDDWDVIKQFEQELEIQQTPTKDTILHVLSRFCNSSFSVQQILKSKPEMLLKLNAQKETSLHIAARMGKLNVVHAIIDCIKRHEKLKSLLRSRNVLGNMALHEAIMGKHRDIIRLLVGNDPPLTTFKNSVNETPLYLAAKKGDEVVVAVILSAIKNLPLGFRSKNGRLFEVSYQFYIGPGGKTALHAAAIWNFPECLKLILLELPHLTKKVDKFGWNALHYAAKFNHQEVARQLLLVDRSMGYVNNGTVSTPLDALLMGNKDGGKTALYVAVTCGNIQVLEEILAHCPDCWSMVTRKGKNGIHLAVKYEQQGVLDFILRMRWASELVNSRDAKGETPLHLYIFTKKLLGQELVGHLGVEIDPLNKRGLTPLELLKYADQDEERHDFLKRELEKAGARHGSPNIVSNKKLKATPAQKEATLSRMTESYQVVTALIITICFAIAFTIPGGYESNDGPKKGQPVFLKRAAFVAFIVSDIVALWSAFGALLRLLLLDDQESQKNKFTSLQICRGAIAVALVALMVSFVTGLYVALPNLGIRIFLFLFVSTGIPLLSHLLE